MTRNRVMLGGTFLALALPVAAFAGLGSSDRFAAQVSGQSMTWTEGPSAIDSTSFRDILEPNGYNLQSGAVTVSADIRRGAALVRVLAVSTTGGEPVPVKPDPVRFTPGASSYTWAVRADGGTPYDLVVQWRRMGEHKVKAKSLTAHYVGNPD